MLLFIAPSLIGLLIFVFVPIFTSLWLSFQNWNLLSPPKFVGLANFKALLGDPNFWTALRYTLRLHRPVHPVGVRAGAGAGAAAQPETARRDLRAHGDVSAGGGVVGGRLADLEVDFQPAVRAGQLRAVVVWHSGSGVVVRRRIRRCTRW